MAHERELLFFTEILKNPTEIKNIQLLNGMFFLTKISEIIYSSGLCFMNSFTASGAHYAVSSSLKSMRGVFRSTKKGGKKIKNNKTLRKRIHGGADAATIMVLIMILLLILMLCSNNTSPCPLIFLFTFLNL
jgi:hypothetical protein